MIHVDRFGLLATTEKNAKREDPADAPARDFEAFRPISFPIPLLIKNI